MVQLESNMIIPNHLASIDWDALYKKLEDAYFNCPTAFSWWHFRLVEVPEIAEIMPKTVVFKFDRKLLEEAEQSRNGESWVKFIDQVHQHPFEYPIFIKAGTYSGKHNSLCFVNTKENLSEQVFEVFYEADLMCVHPLPCELVVRELLPVKAAFHCFNNFPVTKERRYITNGGKAIAKWPYWPPFSIEDADCDDWQPKLSAINEETPEEVAFLQPLAEKVAAILQPYDWAIDFLQDVNGKWWITDVQESNRSFHWTDYPNKTQYLNQ